jgi:CDGSH-type Zn-finger protein
MVTSDLADATPKPSTIMPTPLIPQRFPCVQDTKAGTYYWCTCGASKGQPFCDGSHKGTGFAPQKVEIAADGPVAWCACKHSQKGAFCDGSHKRV